ncbi:TetR/AcrR family transcriptional regulator [Salinibacterium sp.]|uniref:TetR/AcrR family transcriptional regulator n=1 Tax=Salinibacterium sp. TaxID=1915057 RepID=UPI00286D6075|nr:TetR/AcrR family transcriptional regulator [Salinibacterium sp.]
MGAVLQRDAERTRRALLDAAATALRTLGPSVSLDVVALQAGVSKGGLLHHFRSKDELFAGLAGEWMARFDAAVQTHLDPADAEPGRLCRAHIRAAFDDTVTGDDQLWSDPAVLAALLAVPEVLRRARESGVRWRIELSADGLHPDRVLLISRVLDGMWMTELLEGRADLDERHRTRDILLGLTRDTGPMIAAE